MLAAKSSWRLLEAEHARLRRLVTAIERLTLNSEWQPLGASRQALEAVVEALRSFDDGTHRPKGVALMSAMRLRGTEGDRTLLDDLECEQHECQALLRGAEQLLKLQMDLTTEEAAVCAAKLSRHNSLLQSHLFREDSVLRECAERVLTQEDWSHVASAISEVVVAASKR